jgi:hypothetical protein
MGVKGALMCETPNEKPSVGLKTIPLREAVGTILAHDITEIRPDEFKGRVFRKGHVIREEDVCHLQRLGKENLFVLNIAEDEMHEDEAAYEMAKALIGDGVKMKGEPREGKIDLIAGIDGLLKVKRDALLEFNMLGEVMCATLHDNTLVKAGQVVAGTRAVPLVVKRDVIRKAVEIAGRGDKLFHVKKLKKPKAGVVITGNEIYYGRITDAFAPVIKKKIEAFGGEITGIYYAPDDESFIKKRLRELIDAGADILITTGGMSVDPDDVTRFAITQLGATAMTYGSPVLPGSMFLVAYIRAEAGKIGSAEEKDISAEDRKRGSAAGSGASELPSFRTSGLIPVLGIPACGMYHRITVFDLVLPRILAGERIGRKELAELGHGGLCQKCEICHYPVCAFGK